MGDSARYDVEKMISFGEDMVKCLESDSDITSLKQCLLQSQALRSRCDADLNGAQHSMQECQNKLDFSRRRIAEAKSELVVDEDTELETKELEEVFQRERLLREELRLITGEITDLDRQSVSMEEKSQALRKLEQEDSRKEMILSMYASVTSIIPNLGDQSKISGHIVEREKKAVRKFELDPAMETSFDTCNGIWKMINL